MIDLQKWCFVGESMFDIQKPFIIGGYKYATDNACLIRVPTDEPNACGLRLPEGVETFLTPLDAPWQDVEILPVQCDKCGGTGVIHIDAIPCETCNNTGVVPHECDCTHCYETEEDCTDCNGQAREESDDPCECYATICGLKIATPYVNLLRDLPNARVQAHGPMLRVMFDGGEAAVMSLNK